MQNENMSSPDDDFKSDTLGTSIYDAFDDQIEEEDADDVDFDDYSEEDYE